MLSSKPARLPKEEISLRARRPHPLVLCLLAIAMPAAAYAQMVTATVAAGSVPNWMAVNPVTNKIYVANQNSNNLTVIDGATNTTRTVNVGTYPVSVAVNTLTNKIYVADAGVYPNPGFVTVIDGTSDTNVATIPAGEGPFSIAVNPITNKIYVANRYSSDVTVIDAANSNQTATVAAGANPYSAAVDPVTNKVYLHR